MRTVPVACLPPGPSLHETADTGRSVRCRPAVVRPRSTAKGIMMSFWEEHPSFDSLLASNGLRTAREVLELPGVVCSGHPDRHVVRVTLGVGNEAVPALLKREHRTRWRDRLANAWAGLGLCSKSQREFTMLRALENTGIGVPL